MAIPATKKPAPPTGLQEVLDLVGVLVKQNFLTAEQADNVRRAQKANDLSAEQAVIQLGVASDAQIAQALAAHAGLPYVKINPLDLDLDVVTKAIAGPFARSNGIVAIDIDKKAKRITIAVHDPFAPTRWIEEIKFTTKLDVDLVVATRADIEAVNKGFYDLKSSLQHAEKQLSESRIATFDLGNQEHLSRADTDLDPAAAPVIKALDHILAYAFEQRASDIHFEPKRNLTLVRLRIDGVLHDVHVIPKRTYEAVVSRIKLLSGANLAEKRRPQDGRIKREQWINGVGNVRTTGGSATIVESKGGSNPFAPLSVGDTILVNDRSGTEQRRKLTAKASNASITVDGAVALTGTNGHPFRWMKNEVELRVSTMPTAFGEKAVLRIFDPDILLKSIDELGLSPHDLPKFNEFIGRPTGIILVTGPTGSGKTTTLYSVLKHLSKPEVNIVTIEDPIEMVFEDFNQVADPAADRRDLRQHAAHGAAAGPRHHHGRRDPRQRDRGPRHPGRPHRAPRPLHAPHQRRAVLDHPPARPGGPPLPDHLHPHRRRGAAARPRELPALHRGVRADGGRGGGDEDPVREAQALPLPAGQGLPPLPRDGLSRPDRRLRDPPHDGEDPAARLAAGGLARDLQGGPRGGPADPQGGRDREGLPRGDHDHGDDEGDRQVNDDGLRGRVFLVTGSGRGLGAALARAAGAEKARVVVNCRRDSKAAEAVAADVQKAGGEAIAVLADVSGFEGASALVEQALAKWGRIDVLVNTVGSFNWNPLVEVEPDEWRRIVATNLDSVFHMCRLAVPHMREKRFGRIVNFAAVGAAATLGEPQMAAYSAAKAGVVALSRALALEEARCGITVNVVSPGLLKDESGSRAAAAADAMLGDRVPVGHPGRAADVVRAVLFFASPAADFVTGQVVEVAGGSRP